VQVRLERGEVVWLQRRQEPVGPVLNLWSWSNGVNMRFHPPS
jgi:hypothetical protein